MLIAAAAPDERVKWGLLASLALHGGLWLAFMAPTERRVLPPFQEGVPVEVWTPDDFEALAAQGTPEKVQPTWLPAAAQPRLAEPTAPSTSPESNAHATPPEPRPISTPAIGTLIRAKTILSDEVLDHPLSRKARAMLPLLEKETRLEQLCGIEAMAQIAEWHKGFKPDRVVAYAMADPKVSRGKIIAEGAAFRSQHRWYRLRFTCDLAVDRDAVRSFEFAVGEPIPKSAWERYGLPPVH